MLPIFDKIKTPSSEADSTSMLKSNSKTDSKRLPVRPLTFKKIFVTSKLTLLPSPKTLTPAMFEACSLKNFALSIAF